LLIAIEFAPKGVDAKGWKKNTRGNRGDQNDPGVRHCRRSDDGQEMDSNDTGEDSQLS